MQSQSGSATKSSGSTASPVGGSVHAGSGEQVRKRTRISSSNGGAIAPATPRQSSQLSQSGVRSSEQAANRTPASTGTRVSEVRRRISSQPAVVGRTSRPDSAPASASKEVSSPSRTGTELGEQGVSKPKVPVLSTGMADRLAERAAIEKHDRRKKRGITLAAIVVLLGAVWLFGFSSLFALDRESVRVIGATQYVKETEVLQALDSHYGTPLTRLDLNAVNQEVSKIANVKSASQTRRWPHGVTITIEERVPVAAVPKDKKFVLLDISSVQVATVDKAPSGLPVIKIPMTGAHEKTLITTLEILDAIPAELLGDIGSINASSQDNIVFTLRDGVKVQWGNSSETLLKVEVLKRLRPVAEKESKKTIDLSAPKFPIIRG